QRARTGSAEARAHLEFWRGRLAGVPPDLELPADRPRPARISFRGDSLHLRLPPRLARAADGFARARGVTLYMTLLAAFQALLHRYTGREDFLVGGGSAGRRLRELEEVIGMVVNVVPLRAELAGDPSFAALVERVRAAALETYAHQDVPFGEIVEAVRPERSLDRLPLFQVAFNAHHAPYPDLRLPGLDLEVREGLGNRSAKFDLQVIVIPRAQQGPAAGDEVALIWEYSTDLFERATVERMARHYEALLDGALAAPERPVSGMPLLDDAERRVLEAWSGAASPRPRGATVHGLFAEAARRDPDAVAVEYGERTLTWRELDRAASRVAARLRALGVAPEARVGVWAERSPEMVAAMLGTLRAGAACLPLDPAHPGERLARMLADSGAAALLVPRAADAAPAGFAGPVLALEEVLRSEPGGKAEGFADADSAAFVFYTSGSTGTPRGIAVPHRAVVRLVRDAELAPLGPDDRVAQLSNASFDAASWEIWGALLNGGRVVGISRGDALDPRALAARLRERGVTALFLTTSLFNQVARAAPDAFRGVRHVLFGGEAADPDAVRRVLEAGPPDRLLNVYGPTEGTTFSTWHRVEEVPAEAARVPVGRPLRGTRVRVLDGHFGVVPVGVPGELYLGGDGLARGYPGDPGATAARFLPDPHAGEPGARMYRTGDRARWLPSGALELLGRVDRQLKVRGFRVEPTEVEAALRACPGVADAVVAPREDASGERSLDAWVVPLPGGSPDPAALREHLAAQLPGYLVPDSFTAIEAVPLTPNGKTDHRALPAPEREASGDAFRPPRTPEEEEVAAAWRAELGVERVGVDDDFFALGGHSLRAVRVLARIEETLGVRLPVSAVFEGPTVRALAARVAAARAAEEEELLRQLEWLEGLSDEEALARLRP
ncbi:MAG TPA: amino acid adenylation domain-containing protein, partial [Longimicrobiaceae bacterium]